MSTPHIAYAVGESGLPHGADYHGAGWYFLDEAGSAFGPWTTEVQCCREYVTYCDAQDEVDEPVRAALAELVRLKRLKETDPAAHEAGKAAAWARAFELVDHGPASDVKAIIAAQDAQDALEQISTVLDPDGKHDAELKSILHTVANLVEQHDQAEVLQDALNRARAAIDGFDAEVVKLRTELAAMATERRAAVEKYEKAFQCHGAPCGACVTCLNAKLTTVEAELAERKKGPTGYLLEHLKARLDPESLGMLNQVMGQCVDQRNEAREALATAKRAFNVPPLDDDLRKILGRPNFACGPIARVLRLAGHKIATKAEDEQAAVLHWMLTVYAEHGTNCTYECARFLSEYAPAPKPT